MLGRPRADLMPNSFDYEITPFVKPTGFREYDARWLFEREINLLGMRALGLGIGTLLHENGIRPEIVTGHDFRSYSAAIKDALIIGLMASGCTVHDIGLALSPMAYFAQFDLDVPAVAMVTASHNDNGWTGVKIGMNRPLTLGPAEMARLRDIVLEGQWTERSGGTLRHIEGLAERYVSDLVSTGRIKRKLKVIAACGNGTAGAFAPRILEGIGCDVIPLDCGLDHTFPRYNPNPEDMAMLHAMADAVRAHGADVAFGFDGDGDRCGIVDNEGNEIFADKVGVMLARDMAKLMPGARFVVDVKSTSLFATDPQLKATGATTEYWKTGHSYMKARTTEIDAMAGFEKSGHYFFRAPYGRGYDDGFVSAIAICHMLDRSPDKSVADLYRELPRTYSTPTMSPHCPDTEKYDVVARITRHFETELSAGGRLAGQRITELVKVNGVRVALEDGSWGLVRASSNKPELVVVCESPVSEERMRAVFHDMEAELRRHPEIGAFNQKI
ncbi:MAG: phosphomannomutase/phosphoglucomutase [Alphaproteobacteria bacterium]|nr:phosphomannomutase/phosphoglucomutase [Alphaproteobacteria bacterium]